MSRRSYQATILQQVINLIKIVVLKSIRRHDRRVFDEILEFEPTISEFASHLGLVQIAVDAIQELHPSQSGNMDLIKLQSLV